MPTASRYRSPSGLSQLTSHEATKGSPELLVICCRCISSRDSEPHKQQYISEAWTAA